MIEYKTVVNGRSLEVLVIGPNNVKIKKLRNPARWDRSSTLGEQRRVIKRLKKKRREREGASLNSSKKLSNALIGTIMRGFARDEGTQGCGPMIRVTEP